MRSLCGKFGINIAVSVLAVFGLLIVGQSCDKPDRQDYLVGAWAVDSTFTYYNGFTYTQKEEGSDWAVYVYDKEGLMKEIKHNSFQSYHFRFNPTGDSLFVQSVNGGSAIAFAILALRENSMVLKKEQRPTFQGNNQLRYEVRYFSRTEVPRDSLIPFRDPRGN